MTGSIALDVVIGLIFIYLLYSLLGTLIAEIMATNLSLRAKNLKEAVDRMLNDEHSISAVKRVWNSLKYFFFSPQNEVVNNFYNQHEIKYLGSKGIVKKPSHFKARNFSKSLIDMLKKNGAGPDSHSKIADALSKAKTHATDDMQYLGRETAEYIAGLLEDCQGDIEKFRLRIEQWFDDTMEHASEWYKRKIQVVLLVIGMGIAWIFNVNTFVIVKKLSRDSDARDKIVALTAAYLENNSFEKIEAVVTDTTVKIYDTRLDTLFSAKNQLQQDIDNAQTILGLGSWLPDEIEILEGRRIYPLWVDAEIVPDGKLITRDKKTLISFSTGEKFIYMLRLLGSNFFGYFLTALAISMGAPFWFDLLNKLMKLKGSVKHEKSASGITGSTQTAIAPFDRKGK